jgi:copper resistance protein B
MDHSQHSATPAASEDMTMDHSKHQAVEPTKQMEAMDHSQHGTHRADDDSGLRDPYQYADGYDFGPYGHMHMADSMNFSAVTVDHLEAMNTDKDVAYGYGLKGWWGRDFNRLTIKSDGEGSAGEFDELSLELAWGHAIAAYWNTQLGARADIANETERYALALGINGLAPYWFEIDATVYVDADGRIAFRGGAEYELLFTQKLILQPMAETTLFSRGDADRKIGGGLVDINAALRLRYEIRREFAPYLGVEWQRKFGTTADFARADGHQDSELNAVAGLRLTF